MKSFLLTSVFLLSMLPQLSIAAEIHLISVNGIAEKNIEPNLLMVRLESWAKASSAQKAQEIQAEQYSKLKSSLEKFKIAKEDIKTESFNVNPEYVYDQKTQSNHVTSYRVNHEILVVFRKVDAAGDFLDHLVVSKTDTSGVGVGSIGWDSDKKSDVELSLLGDAVKSARTRAEELAKAAGVTIKATHHIQNSTYSAPPMQPMVERSAGLLMKSGLAPATELSSGQIKIRVEVQMDFEI